jgi:hypothetical protein
MLKNTTKRRTISSEGVPAMVIKTSGGPPGALESEKQNAPLHAFCDWSDMSAMCAPSGCIPAQGAQQAWRHSSCSKEGHQDSQLVRQNRKSL